MIGVVIAGHGTWPAAMKHSLDMIYGEVPDLEICQVTDAESAEDIHAKLEEALARMPGLRGYVFLLDIFGGSPCHATVPFLLREDVLVITGTNLAMLVELVSTREQADWDELGDRLLRAGHEGIRNVTSEMRQN